MQRPSGKVTRIQKRSDGKAPTFCFLRSNDALVKEIFAHKSDFADNKIPPIGSIVEFTLCPPRIPGKEYSADFCTIVSLSEQEKAKQ